MLVERRVASDVHGMHTRDASGILARFGRAFSGEWRRSPRPWPLLGDAVEQGGELWR
jgi:hypothetical protein